MKENYSLITGASSGIGLEISKYLASKKHNLILTARNEKRLKDISKKLSNNFKIKCDYISCDLSMIESPKEIYDYCKSKKYNVNVLVNNAGFALPNSFEKTPMEDEERFLRVLSTCVISLTKIFINDMILNKEGKIMIVSSVAAYAPPSKIQVLYGPVKTFMNRFVEALNGAYNKNNIYSTALCPGFTVTEFHTMSGTQDRMNKVPSFMKLSADQVAQEGIDGMFKNKEIVIPGNLNRFLISVLRFFPTRAIKWIGNKIAGGRYK